MISTAGAGLETRLTSILQAQRRDSGGQSNSSSRTMSVRMKTFTLGTI